MPTRAGIIQSNYIPWRGYFDFIRSVDVFVIYDDVQYSTGSWRNRNRLKTRRGLEWITVPVHASVSRTIEQTPIASERADWRAQHRRQLEEALGPAPFFDDARRIWEDAAGAEAASISELNERLILAVNAYLGIGTRVVRSSTFPLGGTKTARLLDLLGKLGADTYLSGPAAKGYLDEDAFRRQGLRLEYKSYDYAPYPQLWGEFEGSVSVLDLIANLGAKASHHIASATPDVAAVPGAR